MKLSYVAYDKAGQVRTGAVEADDSHEASEQLRQQGLYVSKISEGDLRRGDSFKLERRARRRLSDVKSVALWARELLVLVRSGTPLAQAMLAIERHVPEGRWRDVLANVRGQVESGIPLSDAMSSHPTVFDAVTRSLIAAGESSGQLDEMLQSVADLSRKQLKLQQTIVGACVYPTLLIVIGIGVSLTMLLAVVPRFSELFESLGVALPPSTQFMLTVSGLVRVWWWLMAIGLVTAVVAVNAFFATSSGRRTGHVLMVRLPILGRAVRGLATARITRILGVLLESRVPLLDALRLVREASPLIMYRELLEDAHAAAERGESMSEVFAGSSLIPSTVTEAARHGEQNGQVGRILTDISSFLDEENELIVKSVMSLLEPAILILLGFIVGLMALSLFIPMFDVAATAGG